MRTWIILIQRADKFHLETSSLFLKILSLTNVHPGLLVKIIINKKIMIYNDFYRFAHDFLICNKSSKSYFVGQVRPGPKTCYPDGWYSDRVYDLVLWLTLIGINYCFKKRKQHFKHWKFAIRIANSGPGFSQTKLFQFLAVIFQHFIALAENWFDDLPKNQ